jgi:hypothetical protein
VVRASGLTLRQKTATVRVWEAVVGAAVRLWDDREWTLTIDAVTATALHEAYHAATRFCIAVVRADDAHAVEPLPAPLLLRILALLDTLCLDHAALDRWEPIPKPIPTTFMPLTSSMPV